MSWFNQMPDAPRAFGYKILWFAVKAPDAASVIDALEFGAATPTNWETGVAAAYGVSQRNDTWLFVSPPVCGWILAVSHRLPYPVAIEAHHDIGRRFDVLFSRLMKRFDDVQFFGSHRVSDFVAWARAMQGKPLRIFAYADGQVLANVGEQTSEERKMGLVNLTSLSPSDAGDEIFKIAEEQEAEESAFVASGLSTREARAKIRQYRRDAFPDECDVTDLAALWSIDPVQLSNEDGQLGLGLAVRLPDDLVQ